MRRNTTDFFGSLTVISALDLTESSLITLYLVSVIFSWYNLMETTEGVLMENMATEFLIYLHGNALARC